MCSEHRLKLPRSYIKIPFIMIFILGELNFVYVILPEMYHLCSFEYVKVKLSLWCKWASRHDDILGSGGIAPRILDFGNRWRWVVSFTPWPLYPQGKSPWYPLDRRLGGTQSRSGRGGEEKNSQPLPGLEPPIIQPVAQRCTTELTRLPLWICAYFKQRSWQNIRKCYTNPCHVLLRKVCYMRSDNASLNIFHKTKIL
jgi:hypothetical protein